MTIKCVLPLVIYLVNGVHSEAISCFTCSATCNSFDYYKCKNEPEESRSESCVKQISCCDGSDMMETFEGISAENACNGRCITDFYTKKGNLHSVERSCQVSAKYVINDKNVEDSGYGKVEDEDCDDDSNCNHICYCDDDFCNKATSIDDCYSKLSGVQTFLVINAVVLVILLILFEVLFFLKKKKINQGITQLKSQYSMVRENYKQAKFGGGKPAGPPPPPAVITDKDEIQPDFRNEVKSIKTTPSQSDAPEKFVIPVSEVSEDR